MPEPITHQEQAGAAADLHHSLEDVRSAEVQEIMGKMPSWIIRRGIAVIGLLLLLTIGGAYFFRYPDTLPVQVKIIATKGAEGRGLTYKVEGTGAGVRSGMIAAGQPVQIKLIAYPYDTYGMLTGIVERSTPSSTDSTFLVDIRLSQGLHTTAGKLLPAQGLLNGHAEIFLEDKNMLERLFERVYGKRK